MTPLTSRQVLARLGFRTGTILFIAVHPSPISSWTATMPSSSVAGYVASKNMFRCGSRLVHINSKLSAEKSQPSSSHQQQYPFHVTTRPSSVRYGGGGANNVRPNNPKTLLTAQQQLNASNKLASWLQDKHSVLCLTGAGLSTESGIPDYRGHQGSYHIGHKPMVHDQFMFSPYQRKRYWGRSLVGWEKLVSKEPNDGHHALTKLESHGYIGVDFQCAQVEEDHTRHICIRPGRKRLSVITQNVDGLHGKAGTTFVTELHGHLNRLRCMNCGMYHDRFEFQQELRRRNHDWIQEQERLLWEQQQQQRDHVSEPMRPDGDASVTTEDYSSIDVPPCPSCKIGFLKPDVVFFGDTVPKQRVQTCFNAVDACDGLLCIGSSLAVYSAYRFVAAAAQQGKPIAVLNVGQTRAESSNLDVTKIEAPTGATLSAVADLLCSPSSSQNGYDWNKMAM
jgi:NAD-dependent deacetylase sirtuin 4